MGGGESAMPSSLPLRATCGLLVALLGACDSGPGETHEPTDAGADADADADSGADAGSPDPPHCSFETPPTHAAGGPIEPAQVRAGVASRVLPMPIGAPLGGYGN